MIYENIDIICPICNKIFTTNCDRISCLNCEWKHACGEHILRKQLCKWDWEDVLKFLYDEYIQTNIDLQTLLLKKRCQ